MFLRVPVRAIMYTSDSGYTGTDSVTFWGREMVIINVVPAATTQTPSSTVPNAAVLFSIKLRPDLMMAGRWPPPLRRASTLRP